MVDRFGTNVQKPYVTLQYDGTEPNPVTQIVTPLVR
jgi:hypothetical protein